MTETYVKLTASEIGSLWTNYMNDCMAKQILGFMLRDIEDPDIKSIVQTSYDLADKNIQVLQAIFDKEDFAIPIAFSEEDVNMQAPTLFTDSFCLIYINHMTRVGMVVYSGYVSMSYREDICDLFSHSLAAANNIYKESLKVALHKGINARHPLIEVPKKTDFIDSKKYMSGLNPLSDKRPLNAVEISHLYSNIITNSIGFKLCMAFAQTSQSETIQDFMLRAKEISQKHRQIFADILIKGDIESAHVPDVGVSNSTTQTFSDKLMMYHMTVLLSAGIGNYATAAAASQRTDLMLSYERLSLEVAKLTKSATDIMIESNYLEQPPGTMNRKKLAKEKAD